MDQTTNNQPVPQQNDISSKTILVLVVIVVVFSFIGAWVNINNALSAPPQSSIRPGSSTAQVGFVIQEPQKPVPSSNLGKVAFGIEN